MTTTTITCDRCKGEIPQSPPNDKIRIHFGRYDNTGSSFDFCSSCFEALRVKLHPKPMLRPEAVMPFGERLVAIFEELIQLNLPQQD